MKKIQAKSKPKDRIMSKTIEKIMALILLAVCYLIFQNMSKIVSKDLKAERKKTVVIDPGHGGIDGGKQAGDGTLEKDINLSISLKLKNQLEKKGIRVVMTRETDCGLYKQTDTNKKTADLKQRCKIMNENQADCVVSIHQNSYLTTNVKGAQVFYYAKSEEAKEFAEDLQKKLVDNLDKSNKRKAKANDSYYILRHTEPLSVIIECGFLSNPEEADLLKSEAYQDRIAKAVCKGIISKVLTTE